MSALGWGVALYFVAVIVFAAWRVNALVSEVQRLKRELRIRQIWAEARRWELAKLLQIWKTRPDLAAPETLQDFGEELERQARGCGLTFDGRALEGFEEPRALWPSEYAELAGLAGVPFTPAALKVHR